MTRHTTLRPTMRSRSLRSTMLASSLVLATLLAFAGTVQADPMTDDEKTIYYLGVVLSKNLEEFMLTPAEQKVVVEGMRAGLAGTAEELDPAVYDVKLRTLSEARRAQALE